MASPTPGLLVGGFARSQQEAKGQPVSIVLVRVRGSISSSAASHTEQCSARTTVVRLVIYSK